MRLEARGAGPSGRAFTLMEMLITLAVFAVMSVSVYAVVGAARQMFAASARLTDLRARGARALDAIEADLRSSGYVPNPTTPTYPVIGDFTTGSAPAGAAAFAHAAPAPPLSPEAPPGFTPNGLLPAANAEIVFVVPKDVNNDGLPVDSNGRIEWSHLVNEEHAYVVVPDPHGPLNRLVRRSTTGGSRTVCRDIERVVFADSRTDTTLKTVTQMRVTLYLAARTPEGGIIKEALSRVISLRNTEGYF